MMENSQHDSPISLEDTLRTGAVGSQAAGIENMETVRTGAVAPENIETARMGAVGSTTGAPAPQPDPFQPDPFSPDPSQPNPYLPNMLHASSAPLFPPQPDGSSSGINWFAQTTGKMRAVRAATVERGQSLLADPFPRWFSAGVVAAMAVVLGVVYLAQERALGGDWSAGALAVGIAALLLAALTLAALFVRLGLGRRGASMLALSMALVVVLAGGGTAALAAVTPLHAAQAKQFERNQDWVAAVNEYSLLGEAAPTSPNIARIYDEWGEQLLAQGSYAQAIERFRIVLAEFKQSGAPVDRATTDVYQTYGAWLKAGGSGIPFPEAIAVFAAEQTNAACDATCKTTAAADEAQSHYLYGAQLAKAKTWPDAIAQFELVQLKFASSAFAKQAHTAAATALLAYGSAKLNSGTAFYNVDYTSSSATPDCKDALAQYNKLTGSYADTPEGAKATQALAAAGIVTGTLTGFPTNPAPSVYLSRNALPSANYYSNDYTAATFDAKTGIFVFKGVAQLGAVDGYYLNFFWQSGLTVEYEINRDTAGNLIVNHVGPLCPVQLGKIPYNTSQVAGA